MPTATLWCWARPGATFPDPPRVRAISFGLPSVRVVGLLPDSMTQLLQSYLVIGLESCILSFSIIQGHHDMNWASSIVLARCLLGRIQWGLWLQVMSGELSKATLWDSQHLSEQFL